MARFPAGEPKAARPKVRKDIFAKIFVSGRTELPNWRGLWPRRKEMSWPTAAMSRQGLGPPNRAVFGHITISSKISYPSCRIHAKRTTRYRLHDPRQPRRRIREFRQCVFRVAFLIEQPKIQFEFIKTMYTQHMSKLFTPPARKKENKARLRVRHLGDCEGILAQPPKVSTGQKEKITVEGVCSGDGSFRKRRFPF